MFWSRHTEHGLAGTVDIGFTDRHGGPAGHDLDLGGAAGAAASAATRAALAAVAEAFAVGRLAAMRQVHGADVVVVTDPADEPPVCDALVTARADVALCARVADCVPVVLADADAGIVGVAHAGRRGVVAGVVPATVAALEDLGAGRLRGWIGPHICGGCYEVPGELRAEVARSCPAAFGCTTWGTPSVDLGAAVAAQLADAGVEAVAVGGCTRESPDLFSYRRDGDAAGRFAGVVVWRGRP